MLDRPDVRGELDTVAIRRHSRKISERGEFLPTAFLLSGATLDVVPLLRAGIDDDGARPPVDRYGDAALDDFLVDNTLLPLVSLIVEPATVLFLNNAINHGALAPLGVDPGWFSDSACRETGRLG